jgi:calcineurin-like phosphoesterase family protein
MDSVIITRWNEKVKPEDTVYFIGDFCLKKSTEAPDARGADVFRYYRKQLNGNIIFIEGNHDSNNAVKTITQSVVIKYGGKFIKLTHNPKHADGKYEFNFVGHVHNEWKFQNLYSPGGTVISTLINVSVDQWNFRPVSYEEIMSAYHKWYKQIKKEGGRAE